MKLPRLTNQRGNILLFTVILVLPVMLVFAGLATDLGYYGEVDAELQRSMDAAALAGAGNLKFSCTPGANSEFHLARNAAWTYANLNTYHGAAQPIDLERNDPGSCNTGQDPTGDIVLGEWKPQAAACDPAVAGSFCSALGCFCPSEDGNKVNAIKTRVSSEPSIPGVHRAIPPIPTSFLRVIEVLSAGAIKLDSIAAGAQAIAWAPPPTVPPPPCCPIGLTPTAGVPPGNGLCGQQAFFITSSDSSKGSFNTAGWANLAGCGNPSAQTTRNAIEDCATRTEKCTLKKGDFMGINGGMQESTLGKVIEYFPGKFNSSGTITITRTDPDTGQPVPVYEGSGWAMTVPVVDTTTQTSGCPVAWSPFKGTMLASIWDRIYPCVVPSVGKAFAQQVNQNMQIIGWTQFVVTQIVDKGNCVVNNPADTINVTSWPPGTNGTPCGPSTNPGDPSLRGIYGFFNCVLLDSPGDPGAVASLGKPRLVR